ncbi:hypothetical protein V3C99_002911 [Haemonchus contortus]
MPRQDRVRSTAVMERKLQVESIVSRPLRLQIGKSKLRSRNTFCSCDSRPIQESTVPNGVKTTVIFHGTGCTSRPHQVYLSKAIASGRQLSRTPLLLSHPVTPKKGCPRKKPLVRQDTPTHGPR